MSSEGRRAALQSAVLRVHGERASTERGPVTGVFQRRYVEADGVDEMADTLTVSELDANTLQLQRGASVIVRERTYTVRRREPDDAGFVRLILEQ